MKLNREDLVVGDRLVLNDDWGDVCFIYDVVQIDRRGVEFLVEDFNNYYGKGDALFHMTLTPENEDRFDEREWEEE